MYFYEVTTFDTHAQVQFIFTVRAPNQWGARTKALQQLGDKFGAAHGYQLAGRVVRKVRP